MNTVIVAVLVTLLVFVDCQQRCSTNEEDCDEGKCCPMLGMGSCVTARKEGERCSVFNCCERELRCTGLPALRRCKRVETTTPEDITDLPTDGSTLDETEAK